MKAKLVHDDGLRTYVVVLGEGDEAVECLTRFAGTENVSAAGLTAIGAFERACVGYFERDTTSYTDIPVNEQVEVLSMVGDLALSDEEPQLHVHVVLGRRDGSTCGGHLLSGHVWPTLEIVVTEAPAHLQRRTDPETGLALIDLDRSA